jgi:putative ABC transport system permease protein
VGELEQNRVTGTAIPAIFLGVAAFLLNIVLSRLVGTQRDQIAVLKAFGYSNLDVGRHYLRFALAAVVAGALLGTGVGVWLGQGLTELYGQFFRFPDLEYRVSWPLIAIAAGISVAAAALGRAGRGAPGGAPPPGGGHAPGIAGTLPPRPHREAGAGAAGSPRRGG